MLIKTQEEIDRLMIYRDELIQLVETTLSSKKLQDWEYVCVDLYPPRWNIAHRQNGSLSFQSFELIFSFDLRSFLITYGNSDAGMHSISKCFLDTLTISINALQVYELEDIFFIILTEYPSNQWGLT